VQRVNKLRLSRVIEQFDRPEDVTFINVRYSHAEIVGKLADKSGNSSSLALRKRHALTFRSCTAGVALTRPLRQRRSLQCSTPSDRGGVDGYHSWSHDPQTHSHGCTPQPVAAIQGSSTGRIGIPYIVDSERWAEQDGQRGCRANRKSRKLVDPLRCILSWQ